MLFSSVRIRSQIREELKLLLRLILSKHRNVYRLMQKCLLGKQLKMNNLLLLVNEFGNIGLHIA